MDTALLIPWRATTPERARAMKFILEHLERVIQPKEIMIVDDPDPHDFNRGRALNAGVRDTKSRILVFADADFWLPSHIIETALVAVDDPARSYVIPFTSIAFLNRATSARILEDSEPHDAILGPFGPSDMDTLWDRRGTGTFNVVRREIFEKCGGFDPRFRGWGFEDAAWDQAATTLHGRALWIEARGIHLWHASSRDAKSAQYQQGLALCKRYEQAHGNPEVMRALIEEGKAHA